jgi:hypothetical protein
MADIFQGIAPPNVNTTQTTQTIAPAQYLGFLSTLGTAGTNALAPNQTLEGNIQEGQPYIAPLTQLQKDIYGTSEGQANTEKLLTAGIAPFSSAISTAGTASTPIGASQINAFLNPYVSDVNKNLETTTQQNINQSILPALQSIGASTGGTGSQRLLNATGQALGGIQQGLSAQESANLAQAYKDAVTQALQQQSNLGQIANVQGQLGTGLEGATVQGLNAGANLGAQGQAQTQAQINAPLSTATNVANLLKGYTVPTETKQTYSGPASSYGASPLAQIAGLGTLFASGANGVSAYQGLKNAFGLPDNPLKAITDYNSQVGQNATGTSVPSNPTNLGGYSNVTGNQVTLNENGEYVDVKTGEPVTFFE